MSDINALITLASLSLIFPLGVFANLLPEGCVGDCAITIMKDDLYHGNAQSAFQEFKEFIEAKHEDPLLYVIGDQLLRKVSNVRQSSGTITQEQGLYVVKTGYISTEGPGILWERGLKLFDQHDYKNAQRYFERIKTTYPHERFSASAAILNDRCTKYLNE